MEELQPGLGLGIALVRLNAERGCMARRSPKRIALTSTFTHVRFEGGRLQQPEKLRSG